jgi:predicted nucleic acid-binding protein
MGAGFGMIYIDSSCLVKVFRQERESADVLEIVGRETTVIISTLAELETLVQLKAFYLAGAYNRARWRQMEARLAALRNEPPYEFRGLSAPVFQTALRQHRNSREVHCRTLDRLHLAAMEELEVRRLMTHDDHQAKAAREAGFEVIQPGRR